MGGPPITATPTSEVKKNSDARGPWIFAVSQVPILNGTDELNRTATNMNKNDSIVAIYPSHTATKTAVNALQLSGFDMKKLSIVGRDYHSYQQVVGYSNAGDRTKQWRKINAF